MPRTLAGWEDELNLPAGSLSGWNDVDITADVESLVKAPTYLLHDVSAACLAELCFGLGRSPEFSLSICRQFCWGGLVLSNQLQTGARGSMAAIGSLPTSLADRSPASSGAMPAQLIDARH